MNREEFNSVEKLYHYTSFDKALKILASNKLRFGKLSNMNDIHESYRRKMYELGVNEDDITEELGKYRQFSITRDNHPRRGFDIAAMWAHYADKGYGVCLVFDKKKILSYLPCNIYQDNIDYEKSYVGDLFVYGKYRNCLSTYFEKNKKELFFTKSKDWSYEQEYRMLIRTHDSCSDYFLDYKDSLIAIILNFAEDVSKDERVFDSVNMKILKQLNLSVPILELGCWDNEPNLRDESGVDWMNPNKNRTLDI